MDVIEARRRILLNTPHIVTPASAGLVNFSTDMIAPLKECKVHFSPVQDLHGYDHPWPAGGGKNLIPLVIDKIKAINKDKKNWNGDTMTASGISFEFHTNSDGAVNAIVASGTYSEQVNVALGTVKLKAGTDYIINGVLTTPTWQTFQLYVTANGNKYASVSGTQFTVTEDGEYPVHLSIYGSVSNVTFHPMIRLATETDGTFAPYSNVCPITGWTGCEVKHSGADTSDPTTIPVTFPASAGTVYGGYVDLVNGKLVADKYSVNPTAWTRYNASNGYVAYRIGNIPYGKYYSEVANEAMSNVISNFGTFASSNMDRNIIQCPSAEHANAYLAFQEDLDPVALGLQLVYLMRDPVTYDIDPVTLTLLRGDNNIWSNTNGNIDLSYWTH